MIDHGEMDSTELTNKAKSGLKWTVALRFTSQIFTWIVSFLVIRFISPEDYAVVSLAEVVFSSVFILCTLGLHEALIQTKSYSEDALRKVLGLMCVTNFFVSLCLWFFSDYIGAIYNNPNLSIVLKAGAIVYFINPWLNVAFAALSRAMEFKRRGMVDLCSAVATSFLSLILAWSGYGFWALICANFFNIIFRTIGYNFLLQKFYLPKFDFSGLSDLVKFGMTVVGAGFLSTLYLGADVVVAGWTIKPEILGSYAMAMFLAIMPMSKLMPLIYDVVFPYFSAIRDEKTCIEIFEKIIVLVSFLVFPFFFAGVLVVQELVVIILGEQWSASVLPIQIVLLTIPLRMIVNFVCLLVRSLGYSSIVVIHTAFSLVLVVVVVWFATPFGINAIAASWLFTTPVLLIAAILMVNRRVNVSLMSLFTLMYRAVIIASVSLLLSWYVGVAFNEINNFLNAFLMLVVFTLLYALLSFLFNKEKMMYVLNFRL